MAVSTDIIRRVLLYLGDGGCRSVNELRKLLNVDEALFESILGLLTSEGIIEEVKYRLPCDKCPIKSSCPITSGRGRGNTRMYKLSNRGVKVLKAVKETVK